MTSEVEARIEQQWTRYPKSIFVDLQILGYAGLFGVLAFRFDPSFTTYAGCIGFVCIFSAFVATNVKTLIVGKRLNHDLSFLRKVRFRFLPDGNFRATSVLSMPTIITPRQSVSLTEEIVHEIGHLRSGDHRFYAIVKPLMLLCVVVMFGALAVEIVRTPWCISCADPDIRLLLVGVIIQQLLVNLGLIALVLYALFLTVREREYLADRFAYDVLGQAFREHLEFESLLKRQPKTNIIGLWNKFTHPKYEERLENIDTGKMSLSEASFLSGSVAFSNFFISDLVIKTSFGSILNQQEFNVFEPRLESVIWFGAFGFMLFIGISALAYTSSVLAFTVDRNTFTGTIKKVSWMAFGVFCVQFASEFHIAEVIDPGGLRQLWARVFEGMQIFALFALSVVSLSYIGKRRLGQVKDFEIRSHAMIAIGVIIGLGWAGFIN